MERERMKRIGGIVCAACILYASASPARAQPSRSSKMPVQVMGVAVGSDGEARIFCRRHVGVPVDLADAAATNRIARTLFEPVGEVSSLRWHDQDVYVAPRTDLEKAGAPSATFDVAYSGFSSEARAAFQHAVDLLSMRFVSNVPIHVEASWSSLDEQVLGTAGPSYFDDADTISDPDEEDAWFVPALANARRGTDDYPQEVDVVANFNSDFDNWYFGLDGQTPSGMVDFVTVVLHEIAHGVGFLGSMKVDDGADDPECAGTGGEGCWGFVTSDYPGVPVVFDRFAEDASGNALINTLIYPKASTALAGVLQGGGVRFNGDAAVAAYAGARPPLYAPQEWEQGSSYSHLDEATFGPGDPSALMSPAVSTSEAVHDPGPVGCAIFADLGWTMSSACGTDAVPETPAVPVLVAPSPGAADVAPPVRFTWRSADRAGAYDFQLSVEESFSTPEIVATALSDTSYTVGRLDTGVTYHWRVRGINDRGAGSWSAPFRFGTFGALPIVPEILEPSDGAANVNIPSAFAWSKVVDASFYEVQVARDSAFTLLEVDSSGIDTTHLLIQTLEPATSYFWRVRAINDIGSSVWTLGAGFTTAGEEDDPASSPFGIEAAFPNPFQDRITLEFFLPHAMHARLTIYDVRGRLLDVVLDERREAGRQEASWRPVGLPSGIYLCRLEGEPGTSTRSVVYVGVDP